MGETSTNVANVNMAQGLKIHVEDGCDLADPCDSNICPDNSHCSDDWSTHTCVCDPGNTHMQKHKRKHPYGICVSLSRVWVSVLIFSCLPRRLLREGVCGCLSAQPLWARFHLCSQTQFLPRLHLWVRSELLRPVLRKQVSSISACMCICKSKSFLIRALLVCDVNMMVFVCLNNQVKSNSSCRNQS